MFIFCVIPSANSFGWASTHVVAAAKYLQLAAAGPSYCSINTALVNRRIASGLGNTPNTVGVAFGFPNQTLHQVGGPDLPPMGIREIGGREQIFVCDREGLCCFLENTFQHANHFSVLRVNIFNLRLDGDCGVQRCDQVPAALRQGH